MNQFGDIAELIDRIEIGEPGYGLAFGCQCAELNRFDARLSKRFDPLVDTGDDKADVVNSPAARIDLSRPDP